MKVIGIVGLTASGKSALAARLLETGQFCVINADSQQVYNYLPSLSNIPSDLTNHFLYKFLEYSEEKPKFSTANWAQMAHETIEFINKMGKIPLLIGGTSMYFKILQDGLVDIQTISDHISTQVKLMDIYTLQEISKTKFTDRRRLEKAAGVFLETGKYIWEFYDNVQQLEVKQFQLPNMKLYAIMPQVAQIWENIDERLHSTIGNMIQEVAEFGLDKQIDMIGYAEIGRFLSHEVDLTKLHELIVFKTRQYAKRQRTYIKNCLQIEHVFENTQDLYDKIIASLNN